MGRVSSKVVEFGKNGDVSICHQEDLDAGDGIQNAVSVTIRKNRLNAEIAFHIAAKTRFGQLKNLSMATVSSRIDHI